MKRGSGKEKFGKISSAYGLKDSLEGVTDNLINSLNECCGFGMKNRENYPSRRDYTSEIERMQNI